MLAKVKIAYRKASNICRKQTIYTRGWKLCITSTINVQKTLQVIGKVTCASDAPKRDSRKTPAYFFYFQLTRSSCRPARQEVAERNWKNDHDPSSFVSAANIAWRDRKKRRCATRDRFARARVEAAIYIRDARKKRAELLPKFPRTE